MFDIMARNSKKIRGRVLRLDHLKNVKPEQSRTDTLLLEAREISRTFQSGLEELFFDNSDLYKLTRKYGVF
jgi:hypothetical protein